MLKPQPPTHCSSLPAKLPLPTRLRLLIDRVSGLVYVLLGLLLQEDLILIFIHPGYFCPGNLWTYKYGCVLG